MDSLTLLQEWLPQIMTWFGIISTASFAFIAIGDLIVATIDKVTAATETKVDDAWASKIAKWWEVAKGVWENVRAVFDKVSIFSRPKK